MILTLRLSFQIGSVECVKYHVPSSQSSGGGLKSGGSTPGRRKTTPERDIVVVLRVGAALLALAWNSLLLRDCEVRAAALVEGEIGTLLV